MPADFRRIFGHQLFQIGGAEIVFGRLPAAAQPDAPAVVLVEITDGAYGVAVFVFYLIAVLIVEDVGRKFLPPGVVTTVPSGSCRRPSPSITV